MNFQLNARAEQLLAAFEAQADSSRIQRQTLPCGARIWDCGCMTPGSLSAGQLLADICTAGLSRTSLVPGLLENSPWPLVQVQTDQPLASCLFSQYAGWALSAGKFFAMASGPMRAAVGSEEIFKEQGYREQPDSVVGVLEGRKLPTDEVIAAVVEKTGVAAEKVTLLVAPTASLAGSLQVVARVVETAMHKLHALHFDLSRIVSAYGTAPLAPVAHNDLAGIGRTNDAILYGGQVTFFVTGDDESLSEIGPRVPAMSSANYGEPFARIFEAAGRDFYKIDPLLFSPAEVIWHNLSTGRVQRFGRLAPEIVRQSFGI